MPHERLRRILGAAAGVRAPRALAGAQEVGGAGTRKVAPDGRSSAHPPRRYQHCLRPRPGTCGWLPQPRNRQMGQRIDPETPSDWTRLRPPGPCTAPGLGIGPRGSRPSGERRPRSPTPSQVRRFGAAGHHSTPNHEQRIRSVQAKLTLRHPRMNVSAGQRRPSGEGGTRTHGRRTAPPSSRSATSSNWKSSTRPVRPRTAPA